MGVVQGPAGPDTGRTVCGLRSLPLTNPPTSPRLNGIVKMAFDHDRGVAVLVGGSSSQQTWEYYNVPTARASFSIFGTGCKGSVGVPKLAAAASNLPRIGGPFAVGY